FEQCGDRRRLARLDVNLAHAYHRLGRHRQALECSERARGILEGIEDFEGLVAASINSAGTLTAMDEFERAEERYRSAMRLATERNLASWALLSRYNLAYLRYLGGDTGGGEAKRAFEAMMPKRSVHMPVLSLRSSRGFALKWPAKMSHV